MLILSWSHRLSVTAFTLIVALSTLALWTKPMASFGGEGDYPSETREGEETGFNPTTTRDFNPHAIAWSDADDLPTTGILDRKMSEFDRVIREFVAEHQIPGMAVAVTDQGRLVLARGYGFADVENQNKVEPDSLFRIASVSKPITAIAIMTLVEQGKLQLEAPYLQVLDLEAEITAAGDAFDARQHQITIRHLLEHRGGWDREASFDPMFRSVPFAQAQQVPPPANPKAVIAEMMKVKLDFDPGQKYVYSNYGYCLLGRVIEAVSGQTYETYVQEHVLKPLRAMPMQIGSTREAGRAEGEVHYYSNGEARSVFAEDLGQPVPRPDGGFYLEAMDAHGGWIASAPALARLSVALDDPRRCRIMSPQLLATMNERPSGSAGWNENGQPKDAFYGLGWMVRPIGDSGFNIWHAGSLPGTTSIVIRRHDGRNFVALLNTRDSPKSDALGGLVDRLMHDAAAKVTQWPTRNLFSQF